MIGLNVIQNENMTQETVVRLIKKERPWCVVVATSRTANMYELAEARRAFFDDYLYLPVRPAILRATSQFS